MTANNVAVAGVWVQCRKRLLLRGVHAGSPGRRIRPGGDRHLPQRGAEVPGQTQRPHRGLLPAVGVPGPQGKREEAIRQPRFFSGLFDHQDPVCRNSPGSGRRGVLRLQQPALGQRKARGCRAVTAGREDSI